MFPSDAPSGHVEMVYEYVYEGKRKRAHPILVGSHLLRHEWASLAAEAGVDPLSVKLLLNHATSSDVTMGYQHPSLEHLRAQTEKVTQLLLRKACVELRKRRAG